MTSLPSEMLASVSREIVLLVTAPAPANATPAPVVERPTDNAPPNERPTMCALSSAINVTSPLAKISDSSIRDRVRLETMFRPMATPKDTA